jgi:hypothetical protein
VEIDWAESGSDRMRMRIGEATIELLVAGRGDTVVLLPGGGLDASYFS